MLWLTLAARTWATEPTIEDLLLATDDAARGTQSTAVLAMEVRTANYQRSMKMQVWSKGTDKSLVRILEPAKDAGVATLKVGDNLWNYLPRVDRTMKIPAGMMSGSWMGSHFSNDDLVRESRLSEDFTCAFTARPSDPTSNGNYVIACTPKPEAPVVWGSVVATITPAKVPVQIEYRDESDVLVRTMAYSDVREINGQLTAMSMLLTPHDKPDEYTKLVFESLDLQTSVDDTMFSLQALKP